MNNNLKFLWVLVWFFICFLLTGCGKSGIENSNFYVNIYGFDLDYNGNTKFERVRLKTDDLDEIIDLFQEVGDNSEYRDSLLVAEKYAQGLGANAFAQDNLDTLEKQGITLSDINKTQISLNKNGEIINGVLVDYKIIGGLVDDIPLLYVCQLFIPHGNDILLMSYITEDKSSNLNALSMFKNIK